MIARFLAERLGESVNIITYELRTVIIIIIIMIFINVTCYSEKKISQK